MITGSYSDYEFMDYYSVEEDYKNGYIYRYFVQKINDLTITEVNKDNFNDISSNFYVKEYIKWVISGPENSEYKNKILYYHNNFFKYFIKIKKKTLS